MARELGSVVSHGCAGTTAEVRMHVTNCGLGQRTVRVSASCSGADSVSLDPSSLDLGTFARGTVTASLVLPDGGSDSLDMLLWVRGFRETRSRMAEPRPTATGGGLEQTWRRAMEANGRHYQAWGELASDWMRELAQAGRALSAPTLSFPRTMASGPVSY